MPKTQKIAPAIYMTGTNVLIRGTTQFRAEPATLVFKRKDIILFHFYPSATSFDTFVDFSAPPLSVKCGIQNTSNGSIVARFFRKCKAQERLLELDAVFFQFLDGSWADSFQGKEFFFSPVFEI